MALYRLKCEHPECGVVYGGSEGFRLYCDHELDGGHGPALLTPIYEQEILNVRHDLPGIFKFVDWLPVGDNYLEPPKWELGVPLCYRSDGLANYLGLENLYIAFSGYWPERGGNLVTRTFKEFECQASLARYLDSFTGVTPPPLIVSSAGNTANAFRLLGAQFDVPVYLVIPESGFQNLLLPASTNTFAISVKGDYSDTIQFADQLAERLEMLRDGGVRNVGRRAGMGTVMLNAVAHPSEGSGRTFDHYFQAVGSASGAIAAWEATKLLLADGRFGETTTHIHMAQNSPFTPVIDFWESKDRNSPSLPASEMAAAIAAVTAQVLTNRTPPFSIFGGIFDTLSQSNGSGWRVSNSELFQAARLFRATEGVDIGPAGAVATHALGQAVETGALKSSDWILLHVTGGGRAIQFVDGQQIDPLAPSISVDPREIKLAIDAIGAPMAPQEPYRFLRGCYSQNGARRESA